MKFEWVPVPFAPLFGVGVNGTLWFLYVNGDKAGRVHKWPDGGVVWSAEADVTEDGMLLDNEAASMRDAAINLMRRAMAT